MRLDCPAARLAGPAASRDEVSAWLDDSATAVGGFIRTVSRRSRAGGGLSRMAERFRRAVERNSRAANRHPCAAVETRRRKKAVPQDGRAFSDCKNRAAITARCMEPWSRGAVEPWNSFCRGTVEGLRTAPIASTHCIPCKKFLIGCSPHILCRHQSVPITRKPSIHEPCRATGAKIRKCGIFSIRQKCRPAITRGCTIAFTFCRLQQPCHRRHSTRAGHRPALRRSPSCHWQSPRSPARNRRRPEKRALPFHQC